MRPAKIILSVLITASLLAACSGPKRTAPAVTEAKTTFVEKATNYQKDSTTEVLVDSEIKKEDIVKVIKHGDHWHVFTKDGRERITYSDPNAQTAGEDELEFVSVVTLNQLRKLNIVAIKQHGDHYHCYTADGTEYITHDNPQAAFPNIKITQYVGTHADHAKHKHQHRETADGESGVMGEETSGIFAGDGSEAGPSASGRRANRNEIVAILQHGDHYHCYTADGRELVTYSDPRSMYPHASFGIYTGKSCPVNPIKPNSGSSGSSSNYNVPQAAPDYSSEEGSGSGSDYEHNSPDYNASGTGSGSGQTDSSSASTEEPSVPGLKFVDVIYASELPGKGIVTILKHDDHYHVYDKNGKEYVVGHGATDEDIKKYCPGVTIGTFQGKHGDPQNIKPNVPRKKIKQDPNDPKRIVKSLKHGNHWHIYRADGTGGIAYEDPSLIYEDIEVGDYEEEIKKQEGIVDDQSVDLMKKYLMEHYGVDDSDIMNIEAVFHIYKDDQEIEVSSHDLEVKNGKVELKDGYILPKLKPAAPKDNEGTDSGDTPVDTGNSNAAVTEDKAKDKAKDKDTNKDSKPDRNAAKNVDKNVAKADQAAQADEKTDKKADNSSDKQVNKAAEKQPDKGAAKQPEGSSEKPAKGTDKNVEKKAADPSNKPVNKAAEKQADKNNSQVAAIPADRK